MVNDLYHIDRLIILHLSMNTLNLKMSYLKIMINHYLDQLVESHVKKTFWINTVSFHYMHGTFQKNAQQFP